MRKVMIGLIVSLLFSQEIKFHTYQFDPVVEGEPYIPENLKVNLSPGINIM